MSNTAQTTESVESNTTETTTTPQTTETFEQSVTNSVDNANRLVGQVKWFNNRLNYGFITVVTPNFQGNRDVFVHQSHICPNKSTYRTLFQGEYVSFELTQTEGDNSNGHEFHAVNVTGIEGGNLMCDVPRRPKMRSSYGQEEQTDQGETRRQERRPRNTGRFRSNYRRNNNQQPRQNNNQNARGDTSAST